MNDHSYALGPPGPVCDAKGSLVLSRGFLKAARPASDVRGMTSRDGAEAAWASTGNEAHADAGTSIQSAEAFGQIAPEPSVSLPVDLPTMLRQIENAYINAALTKT